MINRKAVTVSLSPELLSFADRLIMSGRYGNVSEVVRAAMRQLEERELDFYEHRRGRRETLSAMNHEAEVRQRGNSG